jgi:glucose-1-phosphate thymidylyltransferase
MNVIIPAAGIGSRLRPQTHTIPKALLHVAGQPILAHILDTVGKLEPDEISIVTGFLGEKVREFVGRHYHSRMRFVQQEDLLGLGYAIYLALQNLDDRPLLIILGDTIVETDMEAFVSQSDNVLGLMAVEDPERFGIADIEDGRVTRLVEKPKNPESNMAVIGLYYISETARLKDRLKILVDQGLDSGGEIQLTDALQGMIEDGSKFSAFMVDGGYDCGKRETLIATNRHLLERSAPAQSREGAVIIQPSYIASTAVVESSIIGPYVSISDGAVIQNSIIRNSIIGYEAEVRNALLTDSLVGHRAVVFGDFRALNVGDSSEIGYF